MDVVGLGISFALWWGAAIALALILRATGAVRVNIGWFVAAIIIHAVYVVAVVLGGALIPLERVFGELHLNWSGKIVAVITSLSVVAVFLFGSRNMSPSDLGIKLRPTAGSLFPTILATMLMAGILVGLNVLVADGREIGLENIIYQSTMPGLDEELFFRGILLVIASNAVSSGRFFLFGAPLNWAGLLVTLLFALGHSLFWDNGGILFDAASFVVTGVLGFGLLWIRERTGSVVFAMIAHNIINVSAAFF